MPTGAIILPNQLFAKSPLFSIASEFYLLEHEQFFLRHRYHKKKLLLHRASLKAYERMLRERGLRVHYVDFRQGPRLVSLVDRLKNRRIERLHMLDPVDDAIVREIEAFRIASGIDVTILETPQFLTDEETIGSLLGSLERCQMSSFYVRQRKRLEILVEDGKPTGGKWSFDPENRQRLPKDVYVPEPPSGRMDRQIEEAEQYVQEHFPGNRGTTEGWFYPTTHDGAQVWLTDFVEHRLASFGPYEDAISKDSELLFHSRLSPLLDTGLLRPDEVVNHVVEHSQRHNVGLASLEGFIRQIIGRREFIRGVYMAVGDQQRHENFWGLSSPLPKSFYDGSAGIEPVDKIIHRVLRNAYTHHIERLMILGWAVLALRQQAQVRLRRQRPDEGHDCPGGPNGSGTTEKAYRNYRTFPRHTSRMNLGSAHAATDTDTGDGRNRICGQPAGGPTA